MLGFKLTILMFISSPPFPLFLLLFDEPNICAALPPLLSFHWVCATLCSFSRSHCASAATQSPAERCPGASAVASDWLVILCTSACAQNPQTVSVLPIKVICVIAFTTVQM